MHRPAAETPDPVPPSPAAVRGAGPFGAFPLELFRRLAGAQPDGNVVVSPLGAGLARGMLANAPNAGG